MIGIGASTIGAGRRAGPARRADRRPPSTGWRVATVAAGVLAACAVLLTQAPASLVDVALSQVTQGRVRLAEASG